MKIILILSDKLDFDKSEICNSDSFSTLQQKQKETSIINKTVGEKTNAKYHFYASTHPSSLETIQKLFGKQNITIEPLLDEIKFSASSNKEASYESYIKEAVKRWKKSETLQKEVTAECESLIDQLEELDEDTVLVTHLYKMETLLSTLKKRKYLIEKPRLFGIQPLDRIRASKKNMHCGGCKHNCLLTNPKCDIGKDKAKIRGIKIDESANIASRL